MTSLSRLIKSHFSVNAGSEEKVISIRVMETSHSDSDSHPVLTVTEAERARIIEQAKQDADEIISNALAEAQAIKDTARDERLGWEQEKQELIKNAEGTGFKSGFNEGKAIGYAEYQELIHAAQETVSASRVDYQNHIESSEKVILEIGLKVAGKILGKKVEENEEEFLALVKRALKNAREYKDIRLHIHPSHYHYLLAQKHELIAVFPKEIDFYIFPDDELKEDSCMIESENGRIDASVDSQLEEIKLKLFELLEGEQQ